MRLFHHSPYLPYTNTVYSGSLEVFASIWWQVSGGKFLVASIWWEVSGLVVRSKQYLLVLISSPRLLKFCCLFFLYLFPLCFGFLHHTRSSLCQYLSMRFCRPIFPFSFYFLFVIYYLSQWFYICWLPGETLFIFCLRVITSTIEIF